MADPITIASTAIGFLGGVFSNPRDKERFAETANLKAAALAGNEAAYWKLRCLSGDSSPDTRANAIRVGALTAEEISRTTPCGYATEAARANAKIAVGQVDASRAIGTATGAIAAGATQIGLNTNPQAFTATYGTAALATISPWVWIALGIGAIILLRRGK